MHRTPAFGPLGRLLPLLAAAALAAPAVGWSDASAPGDPFPGVACADACATAPSDGTVAQPGRAAGLLEGRGSAGRLPVPPAGTPAVRVARSVPASPCQTLRRVVQERSRAWSAWDALARAGRLTCPVNGPPPPSGIV